MIYVYKLNGVIYKFIHYACVVFTVIEHCACAVFSVIDTLYNDCIMMMMYKYIVHCAMHIVHCTLYTVHYRFCGVHCALYSVQCTLYSIHYTVYSVQCIFEYEILISSIQPDNCKASYKQSNDAYMSCLYTV